MPTRLLLATSNPGKVRELAQLLSGLDLEVLSLSDLPPLPEVVEDGDSFEQNATKKARQVAAHTRLLVLADDSGLEVDALDGRPGVRSARYAGPGCSDQDNNDLLVEELGPIPDAERTARYRVVLALADPAGLLGDHVHLEGGHCEGRIQLEPRGQGGFGYDPHFVPQGYPCTMAELGAEEKNRISHRARAMRKMRRFLERYLASA